MSYFESVRGTERVFTDVTDIGKVEAVFDEVSD